MTESKGIFKMFFVLDVLFGFAIIFMLLLNFQKMRVEHDEVMTLLTADVERQADIRDTLGEVKGICDSYAFPQIIATSTSHF